MSGSPPRPLSARAALLAALGLIVGSLALAGCSSEEPEPPASSATASAVTAAAAPSSTATPSPLAPETESGSGSPSPTPTPDDTAAADAGEPVGLACDELISPQDIYDYNPNFTLDEDYSPGSHSRAAIVVGYNGLACSWVNESSEERIVVAVAKLSKATLDEIEAQRADAADATDFGYFTVDGKTGEADAFLRHYWIVADSKTFFEAADAAPIVGLAETSLG